MTKRRGPRMPLGPSKPASEAQVETERIDPSTFFEGMGGPQPQGGVSDAEAERDLEPMNLSAPRAAPPPQNNPEAEPQQQFLPPEEKPEPMEEHVPADLVNRLEQRFGMKPEDLHDVTLSAGGEDLVVSLRLPLYDDLIWAVAVITEELEQGQNIGVVQTDVQRERLLQHLSSVRCVVKIEGEWLWEIFNMGPAIKELSPGWSGESMITVPDFFQGTMAKQVWRLFRHRLHPDLLFDLNRKVENLLAERGPAKEKEADKQEKESDDPTDAA